MLVLPINILLKAVFFNYFSLTITVKSIIVIVMIQTGVKMRYLFFIFLLLSLKVSGEVFFVPGWRTGFDSRDLCVVRLKEAYPEEKITVKSWDSLQPWDVTKENARKQTAKLLEEVLAMSPENRGNLILVGHSIGAQIAVDILYELSLRGMKIHSAALLGAAVNDDDPRIEALLGAIKNYCCIVYNPDDWVLRYLFPLDNSLHSPLGLNGWIGKNPQVYEMKAVSDRFGFCNHYAYIYLDALICLVKKLPPEYPDVQVLQDESNKERVPADEIFWESVDNFRDWQLQKSIDGKFRILDPQGKRRANGSEVKMREAFADVKKQLTAEK